jgi:uncharacterized protein YbaP (TraB family)
MRFLVIALALLVGCKQSQPKAKPQPATERKAIAAQGSAATDPWATEPKANPDDPPTFTMRHELADKACPTVTGPYFFRIEKDGKVSHILGTRHLGVPLTKFPKPVHDAISSAKLAVFEVAPGDDSDLPQKKINVREELGPELFTHYEELVGKDTAHTLERTTPSVAILAMLVMYEDIGAQLDMEIQNQVQEAKIPTKGLERSEFQDRLLNKLLDLRALKAAVKGTKDRAEIQKDSHDDISEYCAGTDDKPGMDDDDRQDMLDAGYTPAELDQIDEEMVFKRNADWIPKLEKILETDHTFIAVGADHLTGPRGVVAMLEKRGYKLTRITK